MSEEAKNNLKVKQIINYVSIGISILYLIVVFGFISTGRNIFLELMEIVTIFAAPVILIFITSILANVEEKDKMWRQAAIAFMACSATLTTLAHFVNLTVTKVLVEKDIVVPGYFQIGKWPSVEMAIDYLAWGFFLGLVFLCTSFAFPQKDKTEKRIKTSLLFCGFLCLLGMSGPIFNNEMLWFIAVAGYAVGLPIINLELIYLYRKSAIN